MNDNLVAWLNTQIQTRGWTLREMSRRAGVSHTAISSLFSGRNAGWDVCAAIARAVGEPPENVFRIAGLLPPKPPAVEDEQEALTLFRNLDNRTRSIIMTILRSLSMDSPPLFTEPPAAFHFYPPPASLDLEIQQLLREYPELEDLFKEAQEKLSEEAIYALIYNIRVFATQRHENQTSFSQMHRQLSDLLSRLIT